MAAFVWWQARSSGSFFIVGLGGEASTNLGPLLPALCAGASAGLMLLVADAAAGTAAGILAALVLVLLPGFIPLHRGSLNGPPLLTLVLLMVAAMVQAPRFSLAYGSLGALGGVFVATEGIGLPLAAAAWALLQKTRERGRWQRFALSLVPLVVLLFLAHLLGGAWPHDFSLQLHGGLDRALRAAGSIIGDQMAPTVRYPALRFLVLADCAVILVALVVVAWRKIALLADGMSAMRAVYPTSGLVAGALVIGLAGRTLLVRDAAEPDLSAVMPLVVLTALVVVVSIVALWPRWPKWGRAVAIVLTLGWLQAALRS